MVSMKQPKRWRVEPATPVGVMLRAAMDARSRELGRTYTLYDLAADSHQHFTLASKVMVGERKPTRAALEAWAEALSPHFDLDAGLLAAGLPPADAKKAGVLGELWRLTAEQWAQLERWVGERATRDEPSKEGKKADGDDEAAAET